VLLISLQARAYSNVFDTRIQVIFIIIIISIIIIIIIIIINIIVDDNL